MITTLVLAAILSTPVQDKIMSTVDKSLYVSVARLDVEAVVAWVQEHGTPDVGAGTVEPLLHYASRWWSMLALLLDLGADPTTVDARGNTVAHVMWLRSLKGIGAEVRAMNLVNAVRAGLDINTGNDEGDTILHVLCRDGDFGDIALAMSLGSSNSIVNRSGRTPLEELVMTEQRFDDRLVSGPEVVGFREKIRLIGIDLVQDAGGLEILGRAISVATKANRPHVEIVVDEIRQVSGRRVAPSSR